MNRKTCQHTQGFTLIEILVSVVLITIVASATLGMLPGLARTNARDASMHDAAHVFRSVGHDDESVISRLRRTLGLHHLAAR